MDNKLERKYVKDIYENIANHFDVTRQYKWEWVEEFRAGYKETSIIYDIGCGNGRNMGSNTVGVDNCDCFLEICIKNKLNVVKGCMTSLPFEDKSGDGIQCIASYHHLSTEERRIKALEEMKRVLKKGSRILISVWSKEQPKKTRRTFKYGDNYVPWKKTSGEVYERYYYIFEIEEIKKLFSKVGLKLIEHKWDCGNEIFILEV
jgi:ubiquinone/menaquinone biosynthesis C-methylase UbiE